MATKRRPTVEQISVERAIELLQLHKRGKIGGDPVVTIVRDASNRQNILSISVAEQQAFIQPGELRR